VVNRVLVALDGREDLTLVDEASALARDHHAELVLVISLPQPSMLCAFAPGMYGLVRAELREESRRLALDAVDRVPQDVSVRWSHVHRRAPDVVGQLACRPGDVVLGAQAKAATPERASISQRALGLLPQRLSRA
jgi:hypothetical protein